MRIRVPRQQPSIITGYETLTNRRRTRFTTGKSNNAIAMTMNTAANGLVKKIENEPLEINNDWRSAGSGVHIIVKKALLPFTKQ